MVLHGIISLCVMCGRGPLCDYTKGTNVFFENTDRSARVDFILTILKSASKHQHQQTNSQFLVL